MPDPRIDEAVILDHFARISEIEDQRDIYNTALKDAWADYREGLKELGLNGKEVSAEVAQFKSAISDRRMNQAERAKADEKADGRDSYLAVLDSAHARARED